MSKNKSPFYHSVFGDEEFAPSLVTDHPMEPQPNAVSTIGGGIECSTSDLDPESSTCGQGPSDEPLAGDEDAIATSIVDKAGN